MVRKPNRKKVARRAAQPNAILKAEYDSNGKLVARLHTEDEKGRRLLSKQQVLARVSCVTYPTIWRMMRDGKFPRSHVVANKAAWFEDEIDEWMESLPPSQLKGDGA